MSRIGKKLVELPSGVSATVTGQTIEVKGPKGTLNFSATDDVTITTADNSVAVEPRGQSKRARQQWGMSRTMVANMVKGVSEGFKKELEINGVGYRAQLQGNTLKLNLGLSHDVDFQYLPMLQFQRLNLRKLLLKVLTPKELVRSLLTFVNGESRNHTKVKASSTLTSIFSAKKVRRSKDVKLWQIAKEIYS